MLHDWQFRPGTLDRAIFNGVVALNEYQLPEQFSPADIVLDIGAHIGAFAYAALTRGCQHVYAVEPDPTNFALATRHLQPFLSDNHVTLLHGAVWRSDPNNDELRFDGYHPFPQSCAGMTGILNTGCGSVLWGVGEIVPKIAFDALLDQITEQGAKRVRLLKLDCEGAEWPILLTSQRLHLVEEICGEFHELAGGQHEINEDRPYNQPLFQDERFSRWTIENLAAFLTEAGFAVNYRRHHRPNGAPEGLGLFFAKRSRA